MEVSLRQLQHLVALAEERSFVAAARRVCLSQPALSRSIQALERDMGLSLLDRAVRGVGLTTAGRHVVERARRVLFEARCLQRDVDLIRNHELGEVRFGVGPHSAAIFLSKVLIRMQEMHKGLQVTPEVNSWDMLQRQLEAEVIDFYVTDRLSVPAVDHVETIRLPLLKAGWYVRASHPLREKRELVLADLHPYAFAFVPLPAMVARNIKKVLQPLDGPDAQGLIECNNFFVLKEFAVGSDVILYAADAAVAGEVINGTLVKLPPLSDAAPAPALHLAIVVLSHRTLSAEAHIAIAAITDILQSLNTR